MSRPRRVWWPPSATCCAPLGSSSTWSTPTGLCSTTDRCWACPRPCSRWCWCAAALAVATHPQHLTLFAWDLAKDSLRTPVPHSHLTTPALDLPSSQEAWNLANDSLRTTLCVRYKAEVVACGILFLATRRLGVPMPEVRGGTPDAKVVESALTLYTSLYTYIFIFLGPPAKRGCVAAGTHPPRSAAVCSSYRWLLSGPQLSGGGISADRWHSAPPCGQKCAPTPPPHHTHTHAHAPPPPSAGPSLVGVARGAAAPAVRRLPRAGGALPPAPPHLRLPAPGCDYTRAARAGIPHHRGHHASAVACPGRCCGCWGRRRGPCLGRRVAGWARGLAADGGGATGRQRWGGDHGATSQRHCRGRTGEAACPCLHNHPCYAIT